VPARVLISGVSTRAAAESAARAGFVVTALDAFGDLDQHASVRSLSLPRDFGKRFTAHAAARAARTIDCDAVAYLSSFENYPGAVASLSTGRTLLGNSPDVLRRVRDPRLVAAALRRRGHATPAVRFANDPNVPNDPNEWLIKPLRSGGGRGIRRWQGGRVPRGSYLQGLIEGTPASLVFIAAGGRAVLLGVSHQLIGNAAFNAAPFRYCGNILAAADDAVLTDDVVDTASALASAVAADFEVVGLNGIDVMLRDGVPYPIEVNPRWSGSMELVERSYRLSLFALHAAACTEGELPSFDLKTARRDARAAAKAIVFAPEHIRVGDTESWLNDPSVRDVPRPGETIGTGEPICTVFADNSGVDACLAGLAHRAAAVLRSTGSKLVSAQ
jgi:uncharacterized protein